MLPIVYLYFPHSFIWWAVTVVNNINDNFRTSLQPIKLAYFVQLISYTAMLDPSFVSNANGNIHIGLCAIFDSHLSLYILEFTLYDNFYDFPGEKLKFGG